MSTGARAAALLLALSLPATLAAAPSPMVDRPAARLQGLDKVTARTATMTVAVGQTVSLGTLRITVRACKENPPIETPESAAFLDVVEIKPGESSEPAFSGWMFASSPALSAMQHPVYDVWLLGCSGS